MICSQTADDVGRVTGPNFRCGDYCIVPRHRLWAGPVAKGALAMLGQGSREGGRKKNPGARQRDHPLPAAGGPGQGRLVALCIRQGVGVNLPDSDLREIAEIMHLRCNLTS